MHWFYFRNEILMSCQYYTHTKTCISWTPIVYNNMTLNRVYRTSVYEVFALVDKDPSFEAC